MVSTDLGGTFKSPLFDFKKNDVVGCLLVYFGVACLLCIFVIFLHGAACLLCLMSKHAFQTFETFERPQLVSRWLHKDKTKIVGGGKPVLQSTNECVCPKPG